MNSCIPSGFVYFKMFSSHFGHFQRSNKLLCYIKVKDLLDIYHWGCCSYGLSLLTDRRLKGLSEG